MHFIHCANACVLRNVQGSPIDHLLVPTLRDEFEQMEILEAFNEFGFALRESTVFFAFCQIVSDSRINTTSPPLAQHEKGQAR